jgi:hypothetical protein
MQSPMSMTVTATVTARTCDNPASLLPHAEIFSPNKQLWTILARQLQNIGFPIRA